MLGRVIKYDETKGFGFIVDEEGSRRFFHISNVVVPYQITLGSMVRFVPAETERGLISTHITVMSANPKFVALDNYRIRLNNIKNYGISIDPIEESLGVRKIYYSRERQIIHHVQDTIRIISSIPQGPKAVIRNILNAYKNDHYLHEDTVVVDYKVLHVQTYENDYVQIHEKNIQGNLQEKIDILDAHLC